VIDLRNKTCLVTGASGGIGAVIARTLRVQGAKVVLHYNGRREVCEELARTLGAERALALGADLRTPDGPTNLFEDAVAKAGPIDVLVNNAATMPAASIDDDLAAWHAGWNETLQVNLVAAADLCRAALLHFRTRKTGGILVNVASRAAFRGDSPEYMAYAASKAGLIALSRSIARGFGKDNVLAYGVAPGFVSVGMPEEYYRTHGTARIVAEIPLGEISPPEDVANVVAFLASGLARHATGTTVDVNGASYVR
jgi:3-oxoacyl-[acyl-carrier protein] reductase